MCKNAVDKKFLTSLPYICLELFIASMTIKAMSNVVLHNFMAAADSAIVLLEHDVQWD